MDVRFEDPLILLLLLAVPALAVIALWFRSDGGAVRVGAVAPAARMHRTWRVRFEPWLPVWRLIAVTLLIVAMARPQRGEATTESEGEGIDIVLAYDLSSSMSEPFARGQSRQDAAEEVLQRFIEARENDRVGLVVFRERTLTLSPLTVDYDALSSVVESAPSIRLDDATAIGSAIAESVRALRTSKSASQIVILLTDGENTAGDIEPLAAARIAESLGIRVYTVGVVSITAGQQQSTLNVDEAALREIASVTGATYNRAEDPAALDQIYTSIDELEKSRFATVQLTRYDEIAPWLLAGAALALALEVMLRATYFRRAA